MRVVFLFLFCLLLTEAGAQDNVQLMNGKIMSGTITDTTLGDITLRYQHKKKTRQLFIENYRIYSFQIGTAPETVLYRRDTTIGNYLTREEMQYYIFGERDALMKYNPRGIKYAAGLLTFGITLADTYSPDTVSNNFFKGFFNGQPGLASVIAPFAITVLAAVPAVQIDIKKVSNRNHLNFESYIDGFERVARSKKVFGALKFSFGGAIVGLGLHFLVNAIK